MTLFCDLYDVCPAACRASIGLRGDAPQAVYDGGDPDYKKEDADQIEADFNDETAFDNAFNGSFTTTVGASNLFFLKHGFLLRFYPVILSKIFTFFDQPKALRFLDGQRKRRDAPQLHVSDLALQIRLETVPVFNIVQTLHDQQDSSFYFMFPGGAVRLIRFADVMVCLAGGLHVFAGELDLHRVVLEQAVNAGAVIKPDLDGPFHQLAPRPVIDLLRVQRPSLNHAGP